MDVEVVDAVRRDGETARLGEVGDLEPDRHAAAVRDVGLGEGDAARAISRANSASVRRFSPAATGSPPSRTTRTWPGTSSGAVGSSSQNTSDRREAREARIASSRRPPHVGVHHERRVGPEELAHGAHPLHVVGAAGAHLHLDRPEPSREVFLGLAEETVEGELEVDPSGVRPDPGVVAAEEPPEREPGAGAPEVPEGASAAEMAKTARPPWPT